MTRRREPVADLGDEDYRIVRHTHDVELAERLMRARLDEEYGPPASGSRKVGTPQQVYVRIVPALPGTPAEDMGWKFEYRHSKPGKGAFPAVVFS